MLSGLCVGVLGVSSIGAAIRYTDDCAHIGRVAQSHPCPRPFRAEIFICLITFSLRVLASVRAECVSSAKLALATFDSGFGG